MTKRPFSQCIYAILLVVVLFCQASYCQNPGTNAVAEPNAPGSASKLLLTMLEHWGLRYAAFLAIFYLFRIFIEWSKAGFSLTDTLNELYPPALGLIFLPFIFHFVNLGLSKIPGLPKHSNGSFLSNRIFLGLIDALLVSLSDYIVFGWRHWMILVLSVASWVFVELFPIQLRLGISIVLAALSFIQHILAIAGKGNALDTVYTKIDGWSTSLVGYLPTHSALETYLYIPIQESWDDFKEPLSAASGRDEYIRCGYRAVYPCVFPVYLYFSVMAPSSAASQQPTDGGLRSIFSETYIDGVAASPRETEQAIPMAFGGNTVLASAPKPGLTPSPELDGQKPLSSTVPSDGSAFATSVCILFLSPAVLLAAFL